MTRKTHKQTRKPVAAIPLLGAHISIDERLSKVPKVIETPKLEEDVTDRTMLDRLRSYVD